MKKILISLSTFSLPLITLAAGSNLDGYLGGLIKQATNLLRDILVFLIALAVVWFIWNVISYTMSSDEEGKGKARSQMIWGVVALTVIISVWGLVGLLQTAFGLDGKNSVSNSFGDNMIP